MIKAVIFDFFDVIHADPQKAWLKDHGFTRDGIFAEASDKLDLGHINADEYFEHYAKGHGTKTAQQIRAEFDSYAKVDEGLVEIIKTLRAAGYKTGLLSNSSSDELRPILDKHLLEPLFDTIIISGEIGLKKPDPAIFELMLQKLGIDAKDAVFVDDTLHNVESAERVGIKGVHHNDAANLRLQLNALGINFN